MILFDYMAPGLKFEDSGCTDHLCHVIKWGRVYYAFNAIYMRGYVSYIKVLAGALMPVFNDPHHGHTPSDGR